MAVKIKPSLSIQNLKLQRIGRSVLFSVVAKASINLGIDEGGGIRRVILKEALLMK